MALTQIEYYFDNKQFFSRERREVPRFAETVIYENKPYTVAGVTWVEKGPARDEFYVAIILVPLVMEPEDGKDPNTN